MSKGEGEVKERIASPTNQPTKPSFDLWKNLRLPTLIASIAHGLPVQNHLTPSQYIPNFPSSLPPKSKTLKLSLYPSISVNMARLTPLIYAALLGSALVTFANFLTSLLSIQPPFSSSSLYVSLPVITYLLYAIFDRGAGLPPGPLAIPIFGNWLQVGNDLTHRLLASMSKTYGPVFLLKLGVKNLVVVSDPELTTHVLHTQGVEFGSRPRNVVFDIFTGNGQDMVFTVYGEHWRKMRRIMTLPFFTSKVVHTYSDMWEQEMDLVVSDLAKDERVRSEGMVIRRRLQLMLYNIMYRMMFDCKFESIQDPLFIEATKFNSERSRLAQSFDYNYGDFIPLLRPLLTGYLNKCRDLQRRRLAFFNNYYVERRRFAIDS